jgi:Sulfotransferase domain
MSKAVFPNTFLIGVQKAGTTTLDDWLAQHPQIFCYESLKDVHLFARYANKEEIDKRLQQETAGYTSQPIVLQSAVNYFFYPQLLQSIAQYAPQAKLIVILRNPVDRAVSSYSYFKKMLRETRPMEEAMIYPPKEATDFNKDNNDFTYIEHGLYAKQVKSCLQYFTKEQLLVLDYNDLVKNPAGLLKNMFTFLGVDADFMPDLTPKNVTGSVKSQLLQETIIKKQGKFRKWAVDNIIDPVFPVGKRKMLKRKLFELNTGKNQVAKPVQEESKETIAAVKQALAPYFINDAKELDAILGTSFSAKWFPGK